jgi:hypothetical protein
MLTPSCATVSHASFVLLFSDWLTARLMADLDGPKSLSRQVKELRLTSKFIVRITACRIAEVDSLQNRKHR